MRITPLFSLLIGTLSTAWSQPKPFEAWNHCTYQAAEWADGDSFPIVRPDGKTMIIRLYGVDCMEWHVSDETDARRLRAQRRYFGITHAKPSARESIDLAKDLGESASTMTARLLEKPFTVHTRMHKALGDGRHERFYGAITCADGRDLGAELVRSGLARAFGVCVDGPGERTAEDYRESLQDLEIQAAKRGAGIWAHTDWENLPAERDEQRKEDKDVDLAKGNGKLPEGSKLDPNTAARDELMKLPRVGETMADRIIEARDAHPFRNPADLMRVSGIGEKTLEGMVPFLHFKK